MAMKQWVRRLQPLRFLFVFLITLVFFLVILVGSHFTHALTLLVDAYNFLCNLIALFGNYVSYKFGNSQPERSSVPSSIADEEIKSLASLTQQNKMCCAHPQRGAERRLRNTFGWARVDVLVILIVCVFLASLYFSLLVEAIQTLIHISHHDAMHHPIPVLCLGITSVLLNIVTYLLIGGYTHHQGSFHNSEISSGSLSIENSSENSKTEVPNSEGIKLKRQGIQAVCRDLVGGILVVICASLVYCNDKKVAKYIDPVTSIISVSLLMALNFPYMKKSCFILLQTIPDHINIESLCSQLLTAFPVIINVHDLHVWQLTVGKTYTTVHIIFHDPKDYLQITNDVTTFFHSKGITHVTIQPEFFKDINSVELVSKNDLNTCLVPCVGAACLERHCCISDHQSLESIIVDQQTKHEKNCHKVTAKKLESKVRSTSLINKQELKATQRRCCSEGEDLSVTKDIKLNTFDLVKDDEQKSSQISGSSVSSGSTQSASGDICVKLQSS